jgi:hypothetical protein
MKVKLLKKLRKRYNWYFNKDNFPVLIDHHYKNVTIYDLEYCMGMVKYTLQDVEVKVKVSHTEWALRFLKLDILKNYGWSNQKSFYRKANKNYKSRLIK